MIWKEMPRIDVLIEKRFWKMVDRGKADQCWFWNVEIRGQYPRFSIGGAKFRSHRLAFFIATGIDPKELHVCHTCDNPTCCNPSHLFLGTNTDNMEDKTIKGRQRNGFGRTVLSQEDIQQIKQAYWMPIVHLANLYHVRKTKIKKILSGQYDPQ